MEKINTQQLNQLKNDGYKLLVDFYATWCGPCQALTPRLENLEIKYPNVKFVKLNVDENVEFSLDLNIRTVPTVIFYDGNKIIHRSTGANQDVVYINILDNL